MKLKFVLTVISILMFVNIAIAIELPEVPTSTDPVPINLNVMKKIDITGTICILVYEDLMRMAYRYGEVIGFPETMQAILLQETMGGRIRTSQRTAEFKWAAYGCMQINPLTAIGVLKKLHPDQAPKTKGEMILMLRNNDSFTMQIAMHYFKQLYTGYINNGFSSPIAWRYAITAYNAGPKNFRDWNYDTTRTAYLANIRKKLSHAKSFNNTFGVK